MTDIPRADSLQAMQSLLGAYSHAEDAEEEEEDRGGPDAHHDVNNISGSDDEILPENREFEAVKVVDEDSRHSTPLSKKPRMEKKITKLVSYGDKDEEDENSEDSEKHSDDEHTEEKHRVNLVDYSINETHNQSSLSRSVLNKSDDEIQLPPEPPGKCSRYLQDKVSRMFEKMERQQLDMNASIQRKKEYRNPSIYEKLIEFCGIDEKGTNYPPEIYNPGIWGKDSYYDSLAKIQKEEMDKREKERKERTKVEFVTATKKSASSSELAKSNPSSKQSQSQGTSVKQERKSKWDTQSNSTSQSASSNKTTVISAVGTLKKPK